MPGLVVNAAAAMEARKPLPEGEYHATLTKHTTKAPTQNTAGSISLEFTVAEDEGEYAGKTVYRTLYATEKAIGFLVDFAIGLGADPEEVTQASVDFDAVFGDLQGTECYITTNIREYTPNRPDAQPVQQTNIVRVSLVPAA